MFVDKLFFTIFHNFIYNNSSRSIIFSILLLFLIYFHNYINQIILIEREKKIVSNEEFRMMNRKKEIT